MESPQAILLAVLLLLPASTVPASAPGSDAPTVPLVIGVTGRPDVDVGGTFLGATVADVNPTLGHVVVEAEDPDALRDRARARSDVRFVEVDGTMHATFTPDDPRFDDQYGPQHVRAPEAWNTTLGGTSRNVCIVDTGVRYTHEDLNASWLGGHDFVNEDDDPWDDHGHGTHVAGSAAAVTDNGLGIAGIGDVGILAAKVLGSGGGGSFSDVASGIQWCADNGGDVISMSLGGGPSGTVEDAVEYATGVGALPIAAAGNAGSCEDCVSWPAAYPEVVAITCTNRDRELCDFSSTGPEAELAAPGKDVLSSCAGSDDEYCTKSGTSMSTPHVSGVATLVWSHVPDLTNCQLRDILDLNAQDLGPAGWDHDFGYGMVDARASLDAAIAGDHPAECDDTVLDIQVLEPGLDQTLRADETFRVNVTSDGNVSSADVLAGDQVWNLTDEDGDGNWTAVVDTFQIVENARESVTFTFRARDAAGRVTSFSRDYLVDNRFIVSFETPTDGARVDGTSTIRVVADSPGNAVEEVDLVVDGDDHAIAHAEGSTYEATWDTTEHRREDRPGVLEARAVDADGNEQTARIEVTVDNRPDPHLEIVEPRDGDTVVAAWRIHALADSNVGDDEDVHVRFNDGRWWNISRQTTDSRNYTHLHPATTEPRHSTLHVRVADHGGVTERSVSVTVIGANTVYNEVVGPLVGWATDCVEQIRDDLGGDRIEMCHGPR